MEAETQLEKNRKTVKIFSLILITAALLSLFSSIMGLLTSPAANLMNEYTRIISNDVDIQINTNANVILYTMKILINMLIVLSAVLLLQYREIWRKQVIFWLILAIIYMMISPLVNYYYFPKIYFPDLKNMSAALISSARTARLIFSYMWSFTWSILFVFTIMKFNGREVKILFK